MTYLDLVNSSSVDAWQRKSKFYCADRHQPHRATDTTSSLSCGFFECRTCVTSQTLDQEQKHCVSGLNFDDREQTIIQKMMINGTQHLKIISEEHIILSVFVPYSYFKLQTVARVKAHSKANF